jgi:hypothetical protein
MTLVFIIAIGGSIAFSVLEGYIAAWALGMPQAVLAVFMLIRKIFKPKRARVRRWKGLRISTSGLYILRPLGRVLGVISKHLERGGLLG